MDRVIDIRQEVPKRRQGAALQKLLHEQLRWAWALIAAALLLSACSKSVNQTAAPAVPSPAPGVKSEHVVRFVSEAVEIAAGSSAEASVLLSIQKGYHLNANPPTYAYLKATELEFNPNAELSVGFISYPDPIVKKFPFAEKPIAIYEGDINVKVLLKAATAAKQGASNLAGILKVQACDDQVCYPPGELQVTIPVTIK